MMYSAVIRRVSMKQRLRFSFFYVCFVSGANIYRFFFSSIFNICWRNSGIFSSHLVLSPSYNNIFSFDLEFTTEGHIHEPNMT